MRPLTRWRRSRRELEVLAAERNDPHAGVVAGHPRDAIALQPAAVDQRRGSDRAAGGLEHQTARLATNRGEPVAEPHLAARFATNSSA